MSFCPRFVSILILTVPAEAHRNSEFRSEVQSYLPDSGMYSIFKTAYRNSSQDMVIRRFLMG